MKAFTFLKVADDLEQVAGLWVTLGAEHAHEALGRLVGEESGQSTPDMTARSFLAMIERDPKSVAAIYAAALEKNKEDAAAA